MFGVAHLLYNEMEDAHQIIDARSSEKFYDMTKEAPNGHEPRIRNSKNLPANLLLDENGLLKTDLEIS